MDSDTNQPASIIDLNALRIELGGRLQTEISEEANAAMAHSLWCVFTQLCRTARAGLEREIKEACDLGGFEGIPTLEARHFVPSHQHLFDSLEVPESRYEPGPSVRPRR